MPFINKDRIVLAVIGFFAGIGGQTTAYLANPPRPDPFTMTDAMALEERMAFKIQLVQNHIDRTEVPPAWFLKKVERIETDFYKHIGRVEDH